MGTIVVGYIPKPEGQAALRRALEEAQLRSARLVVVNSHRGGREFDQGDAIDTEAALAHDPMLVKRLRRLRSTRQKTRSARRLGADI